MGSDVLFLIFLAVSSAIAYKKGIDVSRWQSHVDWTKVKASGQDFIMLKATEGESEVDPKLYENWNAVKTFGVQKGVYHFLRGSFSGNSQIRLIKNTLKEIGFDAKKDILAIDIESKRNENISPDKMAETLHDVLEGLKNEYTNIYIYTELTYWEKSVAWRKYDFSKYKLWIARFSKHAPTIPTTWRNQGYTWWQYTDKGTVDGIKGDVDLSRGV